MRIEASRRRLLEHLRTIKDKELLELKPGAVWSLCCAAAAILALAVTEKIHTKVQSLMEARR